MIEKPPYEITDKMVGLISDILALLPTLSPETSLKLRKVRNIRSVHSSLAIENNSLSLEQVTDVINGRRIAGSPSEIREVKNAFAAYSRLEHFDPYSISDFLHAHQLMMADLMPDAGKFRNQGVGVYDGKKCVHMAPQAERVRGHVENLFAWAKNSEVHPLIKSSVVHYELEFIHPFLDGNGRMGRLWQTVMLAKWDLLFASLPTETVVLEQQREYYAALKASDRVGHSTTFIEFMLTAIADILWKCQERNSPAKSVLFAQKKTHKATGFVRKNLAGLSGKANDHRSKIGRVDGRLRKVSLPKHSALETSGYVEANGRQKMWVLGCNHKLNSHEAPIRPFCNLMGLGLPCD